jgi:glycosyltransferase involved in cell wall biosynthesis
MRVAIGPVDPAGTASALAAGLRSHGVEPELALWFSSQERSFAGRRILGRAGRVAFALGAPRRVDVLHYQSFAWLPRELDVRWARRSGRRRVVTFHGDDCRLYGLARRLFPSWRDVGDPRGDAAVGARVSRLGQLCDAAIVANLELATYVLPYFRRVYVVPTAVADGSRAAEPANPVPVVLHAPSDPSAKGTRDIVRAVEAVRARVPLELKVVTGLGHAEVLAQIAAADVVVDQLTVSIGVVAIEAMQAGKPVLSELDERTLAPYQRDLPVVPVTPDTLEAELEALLADEPRRRELGAAGRRYAVRHSPDAVAAATLRVYDHARTPAEGVLFAAMPERIERLEDEEAAIRSRLGAPAAPG